MAHTVESLSKLLKKTPDQVISILADAGIKGKTAEASVSMDERKTLMSSLSKRSGNKSTISVSRKTSKSDTTSPLTGGVKIQVKKKREVPNVVIDSSADEAILKAQDALEVGRLADQKDQDHDAKRQDMTRLQKIKDEELITQKNQQELVTAKQEEKKATGGRVGYQNAGAVMPGQPMQAQAPGPTDQGETNQVNISYEQLRERLPQEISNEIVLLLSQSYEAFADFAEIQTQADVNEFNTKYNVQLFLPKQAGA